MRRLHAVQVLVLAAALAVAPSAAQESSPIGRWRTIDDKTGDAKSIVEIREVNGELRGTVLEVFSPPAPSSNPLCEHCPGERRNQPIVGMEILWGLRKDGDEYSGGRVLNPEDGKVYRCRLRVLDDGARLELRGYVGISLFGRTQVWLREEAPHAPAGTGLEVRPVLHVV